MSWRGGLWDTITLGGIQLPGRVASLNVNPKRKVERTKPKGTDTPHTKDEGYEGADVDLTIEIWRARDFPALQEVIAVLIPRQPGAPSNPIPIVHPITTLAGVQSVYIEEIKIGMPQGNVLAVDFKMCEWFSPEKKSSTNQGQSLNPYKTDGGAFDSSGVPAPDPKNLGGKFP